MTEAFDFVAVDNRKDLPEGKLDATKYNSLKTYVLNLGSSLASHLAAYHISNTDTRLSNARTPTAHKNSHKTGETDAIYPADIGAEPADVAIQAHLATTHAPANANYYEHPVTHPPSIITQDTGNRFVSDAEKSAWNNKASGDVLSSLATAASLLLVSSGVGTWATKTVDEIKMLLGLGSAAYTESTAYTAASHASDTGNPHNVTAAQAGAATEAYADKYRFHPGHLIRACGLYSADNTPKMMNTFNNYAMDCAEATAQGDYYLYYVPCTGDETTLDMAIAKGASRGIFDLYVNGVLDSSIDFYAAETTFVMLTVTLTQSLIPGENVIKFVNNGKNASSSNYIYYSGGLRIR